MFQILILGDVLSQYTVFTGESFCVPAPDILYATFLCPCHSFFTLPFSFYSFVSPFALCLLTALLCFVTLLFLLHYFFLVAFYTFLPLPRIHSFFRPTLFTRPFRTFLLYISYSAPSRFYPFFFFTSVSAFSLSDLYCFHSLSQIFREQTRFLHFSLLIILPTRSGAHNFLLRISLLLFMFSFPLSDFHTSTPFIRAGVPSLHFRSAVASCSLFLRTPRRLCFWSPSSLASSSAAA